MIPECLVLLVCDKRNHPNHQRTVHGNFFLKDGAKLHIKLNIASCSKHVIKRIGTDIFDVFSKIKFICLVKLNCIFSNKGVSEVNRFLIPVLRVFCCSILVMSFSQIAFISKQPVVSEKTMFL